MILFTFCKVAWLVKDTRNIVLCFFSLIDNAEDFEEEEHSKRYFSQCMKEYIMYQAARIFLVMRIFCAPQSFIFFLDDFHKSIFLNSFLVNDQ